MLLQVFTILVNFLDHKDWGTAFETTIPQRKQIDASNNGKSDQKIEVHIDDTEKESEHIEKKRKLESSSDACT
jgi:hypothetical protein